MRRDNAVVAAVVIGLGAATALVIGTAPGPPPAADPVPAQAMVQAPEPPAAAPSPSLAPKPDPLEGTFALMARHSGKMLRVEGDSQSEGAAVLQWIDEPDAADTWVIAKAFKRWYTITAEHSGMALSVVGGSSDQEARLEQRSYSGLDMREAQWEFADAGDGWLNIINRRSGLALDVYGALTDNGVPLILWPLTPGSPNQEWQFAQP